MFKSISAKLTSLVLALVLVFSCAALAGCSNGSSGASTEDSPASSTTDSSAVSKADSSASSKAESSAGSKADSSAVSKADSSAAVSKTESAAVSKSDSSAVSKADSSSSQTATKAAESKADQSDVTPAGDIIAVIDVKDYGTIKVKLEPDAAPITVENFVSLAKKGFYDGLTFHRIMKGFMIQGGDPLGNGTGGSGKTIKGEFSGNGVKNPLKHTRGVISMARSNDPNSASSQFFIMHQDASHLDGQYAAFGKVTEGMDVVDKIANDAKPVDNNGTIPSSKQPVINSIKIVEK